VTDSSDSPRDQITDSLVKTAVSSLPSILGTAFTLLTIESRTLMYWITGATLILCVIAMQLARLGKRKLSISRRLLLAIPLVIAALIVTNIGGLLITLTRPDRAATFEAPWALRLSEVLVTAVPESNIFIATVWGVGMALLFGGVLVLW
jgi:hypothetical protein